FSFPTIRGYRRKIAISRLIDPNIYHTIVDQFKGDFMHDFDSVIQRAWGRVAAGVLNDPEELARRLARRRRAMLRRPPRAHCLALRASDLRLHEASAIIVNDYSGVSEERATRGVAASELVPQWVTLDV